MIQTKRKSEKKPSFDDKMNNQNKINSQLLMANAQHEVTIQSQAKTIANLLLEVATLKNELTPPVE